MLEDQKVVDSDRAAKALFVLTAVIDNVRWLSNSHGQVNKAVAVGRLFAGARLSWWLGRDVVVSQLLGRGVRRGNSTRNHALSGCARLIRLLSRCLLSATTRDAFAASQGPTWHCAAAKDGV